MANELQSRSSLDRSICFREVLYITVSIPLRWRGSVGKGSALLAEKTPSPYHINDASLGSYNSQLHLPVFRWHCHTLGKCQLFPRTARPFPARPTIRRSSACTN